MRDSFKEIKRGTRVLQTLFPLVEMTFRRRVKQIRLFVEEIHRSPLSPRLHGPASNFGKVVTAGSGRRGRRRVVNKPWRRTINHPGYLEAEDVPANTAEIFDWANASSALPRRRRAKNSGKKNGVQKKSVEAEGGGGCSEFKYWPFIYQAARPRSALISFSSWFLDSVSAPAAWPAPRVRRSFIYQLVWSLAAFTWR